MNIVCEHGEKIVKGLNIYILCLLTNSPCSFQRYCTARQDVINTEGAKTCVARNNEDFIASEEFQVEETNEEEIKIEKKVKKKKEFGTVTLVSKKMIYYDYNGQSRCKRGKFDVKIGDKIEV